jgi:hypothetical protein
MIKKKVDLSKQDKVSAGIPILGSTTGGSTLLGIEIEKAS